MSLPRVAIASLGGTITMTPQASGSAVAPTLSADDLVTAVPELGRVARLSATTLASLPGASLGFADVLGALGWARDAVRSGCSGVVLVQGTDTLEETAYLLDLLWDRPEPLVVTGAMRAAASPGAEGPANLLASVLTAGSPASRDVGAVVVMNELVHAADRVRKTHSTALEAFASPDFGPLGRVREGVVHYGNRRSRPGPLGPPGPGSLQSPPRVALLETTLGDDGRLLRLALEDGFDGVVLSAFGVGHVPRGVVEEVSAAARRLPVVFASRTGAGSTLEGTYGFPGSESDLVERGAIPAGWLDPRKARILLWALLAGDTPVDDVAREFARRSGAPAPLPSGG